MWVKARFGYYFAYTNTGTVFSERFKSSTRFSLCSFIRDEKPGRYINVDLVRRRRESIGKKREEKKLRRKEAGGKERFRKEFRVEEEGKTTACFYTKKLRSLGTSYASNHPEAQSNSWRYGSSLPTTDGQIIHGLRKLFIRYGLLRNLLVIRYTVLKSPIAFHTGMILPISDRSTDLLNLTKSLEPLMDKNGKHVTYIPFLFPVPYSLFTRYEYFINIYRPRMTRENF